MSLKGSTQSFSILRGEGEEAEDQAEDETEESKAGDELGEDDVADGNKDQDTLTD